VLVQLFPDIQMKAKFKSVGKLYLFQRHLIFEYIAFGMDSKVGGRFLMLMFLVCLLVIFWFEFGMEVAVFFLFLCFI
jgi:hypothetical protein